MPVSIVCQVEGWVVRKSIHCEDCYWYVPGSEKKVASASPALCCEGDRPMRSLISEQPRAQKD